MWSDIKLLFKWSVRYLAAVQTEIQSMLTIGATYDIEITTYLLTNNLFIMKKIGNVGLVRHSILVKVDHLGTLVNCVSLDLFLPLNLNAQVNTTFRV